MENEESGYEFKSDREKSWWAREFSLANIVTIITILVATTAAYEKLKNDSANDHGQIVELRESVATLNRTLVETNLSVRELATTVRIEGTRTRMENKQDRP